MEQIKENGWYKAIDYYVVLVFIILCAGSLSVLETSSELYVFLHIIFFQFLFFLRRRKYDRFFIYLILIWFFINVVSDVYNTLSVLSLNTFVGSVFRIYLSYLILKVVGFDFFYIFYKVAFVFVCISLCLYPILLFKPDIFINVPNIFRLFTQSQQRLAGGCYLIFYMFNAWAGIRNSGFMWEPGAYALMLIFLLSYRFLHNEIKLDKHILVLFVSLLTTMSTAGYIAVFFIIIYYMLNNKVLFKNKIGFFIGLIFFLFFLYLSYYVYFSLDFMSNKIQAYIDSGTTVYQTEVMDNSFLRTSRYGYFLHVLDKTLIWPFGYGVVTPDYDIERWNCKITGPNSFATLLQQWGVVLFMFFLKQMLCFWELNKKNARNFLLFIAFCCCCFSNPFGGIRNIIFLVIFYPLIYRKKLITK